MSAYIVHPSSNDQRVVLLTKLVAQLGLQPVVVSTLADVRHHGAFGKDRSLVVVPELGASDTLEASVQFAGAEGRRAYLAYIADSMTADSYKRLVRTGAGEWIKWQAVTREMIDVVRMLQSKPPAPPAESATIVSFVPSKGGVGNSTLALETAVALAARRKGRADRVAVLDLNFQGGTLADYLDLEARFDIGEIAHRPERLDAQLIEIFASKHPSSVDVFSSPPRQIRNEDIEPEVIFALLDEVGKLYDIVLLDLPNHWQPWCDNVVQGSSAVLLTTVSTVPAIRQVAARQKRLDEMEVPNERMAVVVNQCETSFLGRVARRPDIEKTFPDRRMFFVVQDTNLASEAVNTGRPMTQVAPRRKVVKNIQAISRWIRSLRDQAGGKH